MTLREARDMAGLTRDQLAALAGVKSANIYDIEAGRNKRPAHEIVVRIIRAFHRRGMAGITAETLFPVSELSATAKK